MTLQETLAPHIKKAISNLYNTTLETVEFQATRKDFDGDITVVVFAMLGVVKGNPEQIGEAIGNYLVEQVEDVLKFNVVKGFLNLVLSDGYYLNFFKNVSDFSNYGKVGNQGDAMLVEYSSPNTNKPLHLGHLRNNALGLAISNLLEATGHKVIKANLVNDRGVHICKSM